MFKSISESQPDFVNDLGTKWWLDKDTIFWASRGDINLLEHDFQFWYVEMQDGFRSRLITKGKKIIYDNTSSEAIAIKIDIYKMLIRESLNEHIGKKLSDSKKV